MGAAGRHRPCSVSGDRVLATDLLDPLIGASSADSALAPAVVASGLTRDAHVARLTSPTRLAALRATGLLDGVADPVLDRVARLTTRLLGVPVALVSLVGDDAQHFPGLAGLGGWAGAARVTPLSHSFCQHVVATDAPLLVPDAAQDPLVRDNLARGDLGVVAYAGVPLRTAEGETLGALCAIDGSPVAWSPTQVATLEDLAAAAMAEIELRATVHALVALRDRLENDAVHDHLTGLLNRRGFTERVAAITAGAAADAAHTMVLLDLDGFKTVNDTLGHERGDALLREAALAIAATARDAE